MNLQTADKKNPQNVNYNDLLLKIARDKDRAAFIEVFNFFAPRIKSYLLKRGQNETSAEEIVQNTMLTVWEKAYKYSPEKAAASTWIFTIARNKMIDAIRKRKDIYVDSESPELLNLSAEVKESYADKNTIHELSAALKNLPKEQSRLIHMAFFDHKTYAAHCPERCCNSVIKGALRGNSIVMDAMLQVRRHGTGIFII